MNNPLVSVLMPCYNVELYVKEALDSILSQTYSNLEVIVIDDASTDNTSDVLATIALSDSRIKVVKNEINMKLIATLNKGVALCSGMYIARMDADDISFPNRIEKQVEFLENNLDYDIVSTQFYTFRTGHKKRNLYHNPEKYEDLKGYLLFRSGICHPAVMIRRELFTDKGLSFQKGFLHVEDYALWVKALYVTKMANLPDPLLYYRIHDSQVSVQNDERQIENKKGVFKIHCQHLGLPQTDEFISVYASVAECVPEESSLEFLEKCEHFIQVLLDKNDEIRYCSKEYLIKILSLHWLRLCANSQLGLLAITKCKQSRFFIKENYTSNDILILYIKCLFRMEYKKSFLYRIFFR